MAVPSGTTAQRNTTPAAVRLNTETLNFEGFNGSQWATFTSNLTGPVISFSGGTTGLTPSIPTTGDITLAGTLAVTNGGTGLTSVTANRIPYGSGTSALNTSANLTFNGTTLTNTGNAIISDNSANAALRVTQLGAGNALLVEDSANPDATPFVVTADGTVIRGYTSPVVTDNYVGTQGTPLIQTHANATTASGLASFVWESSATSPAPSVILSRSRSATIGSFSSVASGDAIGAINFNGDDGTAFVVGASILASVDGTPGTSDMPGRLVFSTTADGANTPTERMRIDSTGAVGIGTTSLGASYGLRVSKTLAGDNGSNIFSAATGTVSTPIAVYSFRSTIATGANGGTPYTITNLYGYNAAQGTFNADSTVANQFGFRAESNLIGATNNYGFYSIIPAGTGRYNFYAAGTADNFFGGATTISVNSASDALRITQIGAGNALVVEDSANPDATPTVIDANGRIVVGHTSPITVSGSASFAPPLEVIGTSFGNSSIAALRYSNDTGGSNFTFAKNRSATIGSFVVVAANDALGELVFDGSDGTNYIRAAQIRADVDGTPGTNDMPGRLVFSTTADGASSPTERMRISSSGGVGIGGTPSADVPLLISQVGTAVNMNGVRNTQVTPATATASHKLFQTVASTAASAFTLPILTHYEAFQSTIGAGSTVTSQYGFFAQNNLIGATNNYGFWGNIASGTGRYNFYAAGTAANVFVGTTSIGGTVGTESLRVTPVASAVNYLNVQGAATGSTPVISAAGSDADINIAYLAKGTSSHFFQTSGGNQFRISHTASAVNYLQATGAATGVGPVISAQGSDADIDISLTPKGTGNVRFGTYTAGVVAQAGYITIKDAGGTTRRLLVG
jgi:hypothetical protein